MSDLEEVLAAVDFADAEEEDDLGTVVDCFAAVLLALRLVCAVPRASKEMSEKG